MKLFGSKANNVSEEVIFRSPGVGFVQRAGEIPQNTRSYLAVA
jgi:hypothetical protein